MDWQDFFATQQNTGYYQQAISTVAQERAAGIEIFPADEQIFTAFSATPLAQLKVVILGQDPYHDVGQAHGLSFSVPFGVAIPPSLRNIYKELASDIVDFNIPNHGYLQAWAEQGILLLNTVLTVRAHQAHSHKDIGWTQFTDAAIRFISEHCQGVIFVLWGSHAQKKASLINAEQHYILSGVHPSPLSAYRGFFGCGHFSQINRLLAQQCKPIINWHLTKI